MYLFLCFTPSPTRKNAITVSQSMVLIVYCNCHFFQALHLVMYFYMFSYCCFTFWRSSLCLTDGRALGKPWRAYFYVLTSSKTYLIDLSVFCTVKIVMTSFYRMISILEPVILWISEQVSLVSTVWDAGGQFERKWFIWKLGGLSAG